MPHFGESHLWNKQGYTLRCVECGKAIEGEPYQASFDGWCANFNPVHFCSKECWDGSVEFNTDNWG
jgi:hypothetical protein